MWREWRDAPDDAALVLVVALHVEVTVVGDGEDVWRHLSDLLVGVQADLVGRVDGQQLVGIDGHQDGTSVRLSRETQNGISNTFQGRNMSIICECQKPPKPQDLYFKGPLYRFNKYSKSWQHYVNHFQQLVMSTP